MRLLFFFLFVTSFVWSQLPASPNNGIPRIEIADASVETMRVNFLQRVILLPKK